MVSILIHVNINSPKPRHPYDGKCLMDETVIVKEQEINILPHLFFLSSSASPRLDCSKPD